MNGKFKGVMRDFYCMVDVLEGVGVRKGFALLDAFVVRTGIE